MENNKEYTDEYEKKTCELIKKLNKKHFGKNAVIFREAANQIIKSANPEAKEIYNFMFGMSKQQEAKSEKDPKTAIKLFDEALIFLGKCNWEDKISNEYSETKILKLKKEIEINKKNFTKLTDLFFEIATEENKRGNEESYRVNMGVYHLYNGIRCYPQNPAKALKEIDLSAKSFEKINKIQFKHKILGIKYRLLAHFQPTYESRLSLLNKALKEIENTEDNFGFNEVKGSICYVSAQSERDQTKKAILFKEAAEYYKKDRLFNNYHDAIGWANLWEIHNQPIGLDKSIILLKKARGHFKKADNPRGFHNSSGFLFLLKAIKEGIVQRKKKKFVGNLARANHHFARCQHHKYLNFTAGVALFSEASKLPDEKSKEVFKKSAEILQTINEDLYHLAYFQYYRIEAHKNLDNDDYRIECLGNALTHIDAWLDSLKDRPSPKTDLLVPPNFNLIIEFYSAEALYLKGIIEKDPSKRENFFRSAITKYDEIIDNNFLPSRAWRAKGWTLMFLFEFDSAHNAFSKAYKLNSKDKSIQKDVEFATDQLKKGFRDLKQMLRKEFRFSRNLQKFLAGKIAQSRHLLIYDHEDYPGQEFYQQAISSLQRAGLAVEENYPRHIDKDEEGLRDEMIQCLKMLNINVSAESKKARGKRDIVLKDDFSNKELTAECLVWKGIKYYSTKKDQLFDRYLTWHNREATLVTFVRNKNFVKILSASANEIKQLSGMVEGSFQDLSHEAHKLFVSEHTHKSGVTIRLYHTFFHLPIDD
jgi:hypothetical protein